MLKTMDLFAGAGGLSFGFQQTGGFKLVAAAEINKNARETYKANIVSDTENFVFINNVRGYDFSALNEDVGGIDVVIGGPPCQGFSNANRQKNHVISINNALVKEYFRAIKEVHPIAFVMENVSMLESDKHRFYDSSIDNATIEELINTGFDIPKRNDTIFISTNKHEEIDLLSIVKSSALIAEHLIPESLYKLLNILSKHYNNEQRMTNFLQKQEKILRKNISDYILSCQGLTDSYHTLMNTRMQHILSALSPVGIIEIKDVILDIVSLQKSLISAYEIHQNKLIGDYRCEDGTISFYTKSYSVIDYINAILGDDYIQCGGTLNAEWFGVPQYRRRHVIVGIRKDRYSGGNLLPRKQESTPLFTVWDAIKDLQSYDASYDKNAPQLEYTSKNEISEYGKLMRSGSIGVSNHLTTKTTDVAMKRFKAIQPGKNFHSLSNDLKTTYTKPERTQNTIYLRLDPSEPSGTVVNVRKSMWIHPKLDRAITVREAARLQSFPDKYIFSGTKDSQFQQVGNAVPPLLAKAIAENLLKIL